MKRRILFFATTLIWGVFSAGMFAQTRTPEPVQEKRVVPMPITDAPAILTPEQEKAVQEFLQQTNPDLAKKMLDIRIGDPQRYQWEIQNALEMMHLRKQDPERFARMAKIKALEERTHELAINYNGLDAAGQEKLKGMLLTTLDELFDLREMEREDEMKRMEKRLAELRESLAARKKNKSQIVDRRLLELIGKKSYLEWE